MPKCFQRYWPCVSVFSIAAAACAPSPSGPPPGVAGSNHASSEPKRLELAAMRLAPLSATEQQLERQLRADVAEVLSAGERHARNDWGLAVVTDNLAARLEGLELAVDREGFVGKDGALGQNLVVNLRGSGAEPEIVMLGTRFDSVPGSPGADDNASGVAALLAVARALKDRPRQRTLQLVWFSDASGREVPESMGAWQYLEGLAKRREDADFEEPRTRGPFRACVEVHGLGVYSDAPNSQQYSEGMPPGHPIGEFVEVAAMAHDSALGGDLATAMRQASSVPIKGVTWLEPEATGAMTAFRAYGEHGCPAVLVSDTQKRRFSGFGTPEDTIERLDFGRLARAVNALIAGVDDLLNAKTSTTEPAAPRGSASAAPSEAAVPAASPAPAAP